MILCDTISNVIILFMYGKRKNNDDPFVKIKYAITSQYYDYLQRIPVYDMQIIVRMTLIYSNLSI